MLIPSPRRLLPPTAAHTRSPGCLQVGGEQLDHLRHELLVAGAADVLEHARSVSLQRGLYKSFFRHFFSQVTFLLLEYTVLY